MGIMYQTVQASVALTSASDFLTFKAGATNSLIVREFTMSGLGTASAANEIGMYRTTTGTVTTANFFPLSSSGGTAPAAAARMAAAGVATTLGNRIKGWGLNANGALFRWVAAPGLGFELGGAIQSSIRAVSGSSNAVGDLTIEEF